MVVAAQPSRLRNAATYVTHPRELRPATNLQTRARDWTRDTYSVLHATPRVNWAHHIHVFRYARQHDAESLRRGFPSLLDCSLL